MFRRDHLSRRHPLSPKDLNVRRNGEGRSFVIHIGGRDSTKTLGTPSPGARARREPEKGIARNGLDIKRIGLSSCTLAFAFSIPFFAPSPREPEKGGVVLIRVRVEPRCPVLGSGEVAARTVGDRPCESPRNDRSVRCHHESSVGVPSVSRRPFLDLVQCLVTTRSTWIHCTRTEGGDLSLHQPWRAIVHGTVLPYTPFPHRGWPQHNAKAPIVR